MEGVESFTSFAVTDQLNLRADYTATFTRDETSGLGLLRRPGNKASLAAIWSPMASLSVSATLLYVGPWVDINRSGSIPRVAAPGYTTVNLAASYRVDKHVTTFGRVDNLFDAHYENPIGFNQRGFGIFGGVRLSE